MLWVKKYNRDDIYYFAMKVTGDQVPRFKREMCYSFELIQCEHCKFYNEDKTCQKLSTSTFAFIPPDWFYCAYGKPREEK